MLLMHCLAEITHSTQVYQEQFIWKDTFDLMDHELMKYLWNTPTLKEDYLMFASFDVDGLDGNAIGFSWGTTDLEENHAPNRFLLMSGSGTWQVVHEVPYNQVKLFEKRGRLQTKDPRQVRMAIMALHGQYYFYINDMNTPVFQCYQHELSLPHGTPQLYFDRAAMPAEVNFKIWQLYSHFNGELSVEDLLQDGDGAY
jgi:hypothetical protein